jgi:hypothetical protein
MAQIPEAGTIARLPDEILRSPTLGAWRRAHGVTGPCEYARVAFAFEIVQAARRLWVIDQLGSVILGLTRGADPDHIAPRLRRLADLIDGGEQIEERAA